MIFWKEQQYDQHEKTGAHHNVWFITPSDAIDCSKVSFQERQILRERLSTTQIDTVLLSNFSSCWMSTKRPLFLDKLNVILSHLKNSAMLIMYLGVELPLQKDSLPNTLFF